jgi:asparagine synthase (glutamine-hydrolysing)
MCGICGSTDDPDGRAVRTMAAALVHRGPDDEGQYVDRKTGAALGARRLSIIDVEGGRQPLANEDGSVWAVLNGEIYNHPALRRELAARGHRLATGCDTEVLVHLYEDYGDALVHALEGMFAFAIWDERRARLLLARDRFGEKPLFYTESGEGLVFASELTALLQAGAADGELDPAAVDDYFVFGYVPGPGSIVNGVKQLPPAHRLVWQRDDGAHVVERYWEPPLHAGGGGPVWEDFVAEAERVFEASVRGRLISDVPLGIFLSGGVDSTLVATLAARCSTAPVKTYTIGYDEGAVNETSQARDVAALIGADHHDLVLSSEEAASRAVDVLSALDQPIADQALVALHAVAEFARREVTVAVGGEGADELFGGYPRYRWLGRADELGQRLPEPLLRAGATAMRSLPSRWRATRLVDVLDPKGVLDRHIDWVTDGRRHVRHHLYGPTLSDLSGRNGRVHRTFELLAETASTPDGKRIPELFMRLDQNHWLPDDVLAKADRATMLVSLEMRTPYLHREIAELAATMPVEVHLRGGGKALIRELVRRALPKADFKRAKTAFRVPAAAWLRGPLATQLQRQQQSGPLCEEGWFDRRALGELIERHVTGKADHATVLWPVLSFGLWLDTLRGTGA